MIVLFYYFDFLQAQSFYSNNFVWQNPPSHCALKNLVGNHFKYEYKSYSTNNCIVWLKLHWRVLIILLIILPLQEVAVMGPKIGEILTGVGRGIYLLLPLLKQHGGSFC